MSDETFPLANVGGKEVPFDADQHCRQCRSDAIGRLGCDVQQEFQSRTKGPRRWVFKW